MLSQVCLTSSVIASVWLLAHILFCLRYSQSLHTFPSLKSTHMSLLATLRSSNCNLHFRTLEHQDYIRNSTHMFILISYIMIPSVKIIKSIFLSICLSKLTHQTTKALECSWYTYMGIYLDKDICISQDIESLQFSSFVQRTIKDCKKW